MPKRSDFMAQEKTVSDLFSNPIVKKISKIKETSDNCASYRGIAAKCGFFMLMVVAGVAVEFLIRNAFPFEPSLAADGMYANIPELIGAGVAVLFLLIFSIAGSFVLKLAPIFGAISCLSYGYIFAFLGNVIETYGSVILLALIFTVAIVAAMQILFSTGKIKVTNKFVTVLLTILISSLIGSLLVFVCSFIPGLREVVEFVRQNTAISILMSIGGVILASLFLLVDFSQIQQTVENKLPKKYEWAAAFSLTFTVIWLYLEILNLLSKVKDSSK